MSTRYFRAENANRLIAGVKFEPLEIRAGTLVGILAADPPKADDLGALAQVEANAIEEISKEVYLEELKKKAPHLAALPHSNHPSSPSQPPIKGKGAIVVQGSDIPAPPAPEGEPVEKAEDALKLGAVSGFGLPAAASTIPPGDVPVMDSAPTAAANPPGTPVPEDQKPNEPKVAEVAPAKPKTAKPKQPKTSSKTLP